MAATAAGPRHDIDLNHFSKLLQAERDRLAGELRRMDAQTEGGGSADESSELSSSDQHDADQATELFLRERDQAMQVQLKQELEEVDAASDRLEKGRYGYCERCDSPVPKARLEALPFTAHCVQCAGDIQGRF